MALSSPMKAFRPILFAGLLAALFQEDIVASSTSGLEPAVTPRPAPLAASTPENSPHSPFQFPSDLQVGRELERFGDLDGTIASYRKVLESQDPELRAIALSLI